MHSNQPIFKMKKAFVFFGAVTLLVLSSCNLDKWVARDYAKSAAKGPYDVIIVPGFPYDTITATGKTPPFLNVRVYWAKALYDRGLARNIIFSGAAVHTPFIEAEVMKIAANSIGIPAEHTFVEPEALHSNENVALGYKLAHKLGFKKIAVATDAYQFSYIMAFLSSSAHGAGILPLSRDSIAYYDKPLPKINPYPAYVRNFVPIEDRH
jgi:uncharacterized SAM-binding protein YcdF (DUF218 family)